MFTDVLLDFGLAFLVGFCWGVLFGTPFKALWFAALLGGIGHVIRFTMLHADFGIILSTLVASIVIGLLGIIVSHKVHTPPVVFTMPAAITMIPGLYAYRTILGLLKFTDINLVKSNPMILQDIAHNAILTLSLLFTLAVGISISVLLFRSKSVKEIRLPKIMR